MRRQHDVLPPMIIVITGMAWWMLMQLMISQPLVADGLSDSSGLVPSPPSSMTSPNMERCQAAFPAFDRQVLLPLVASGPTENSEDAGNVDRAAALRQAEDRTVPLGLQLGDVGQYYSQIAPSVQSTVTLRNKSAESVQLALTIYRDDGIIARRFDGCRLAGTTTYQLGIDQGDLFFRDGENAMHADDFCSGDRATPKTESEDPAALHGIFHAQLVADLPDALEVLVNTTVDGTHQLVRHVSAGSYRPPAAVGQIGDWADLPAVVATRNAQNWWDTEIVVQNSGAEPFDLTFTLCTEDGSCFANNQAQLAGFERRSFLASHLLYQNVADQLIEHAGWFAVRARATPTRATAEPPQMAVISQIFRQPVAQDAMRPEAELGSECLYTSTNDRAATRYELPLVTGEPVFVRLMNAGDGANLVTLQMVNAAGLIISSQRTELADQAVKTLSLGTEDVSPIGREAAAGGRLVIRAAQPLSVFAWQSGNVLRPVMNDAGVQTWYLPFLGAPVVEFRWDRDEDTSVDRPLARYGLAETRASVHHQRPVWARQMNWYSWSAQRRLCDERVDEGLDYSTYMLMWKGLLQCSGNPTDRSCINSEERLQAIRNVIPSNCAGRPLFLANEPDLPHQAFMSYPELGRMLYIFRNWPGELISPVFASKQYDAPTYVPERTPWCREAVASGTCPGPVACAQCVQDGVIDGVLDPFDISFQGFEEYFGRVNLWAAEQRWSVESVLDGMALHVYINITDLLEGNLWQAPYLHQFRDRAVAAGWPILVKEYGFVTWPDEFGQPAAANTCNVSQHLGDLRRFVEQNLGDRAEQYDSNPRKLFWFHTGCPASSLREYTPLCLFGEPAVLTTPVGRCWLDDAVSAGDEPVRCTLPCSATYLPLLSR